MLLHKKSHLRCHYIRGERHFRKNKTKQKKEARKTRGILNACAGARQWQSCLEMAGASTKAVVKGCGMVFSRKKVHLFWFHMFEIKTVGMIKKELLNILGYVLFYVYSYIIYLQYIQIFEMSTGDHPILYILKRPANLGKIWWVRDVRFGRKMMVQCLFTPQKSNIDTKNCHV